MGVKVDRRVVDRCVCIASARKAVAIGQMACAEVRNQSYRQVSCPELCLRSPACVALLLAANTASRFACALLEHRGC